jgi:hypothetical protein
MRLDVIIMSTIAELVPAAFVAVTMMLVDPRAVGVPVMDPETGSMLRPGGSPRAP